VFFIGNLIGSTFLSRLGDTIGRIHMLRLGLSVTVFCYGTIIFYAKTLTLNYILIFCVGVFSCFRLNIGFIYGQEIIRKGHANVIGSLYNTLDAMTMIFTTLYYLYISRNWYYISVCFFSITIIALIISFFLPESPKFLVSKGHFLKAKHSFNRIASINNMKPLCYSKDAFKEELEYFGMNTDCVS
jgi:MFS family permease